MEGNIESTSVDPQPVIENEDINTPKAVQLSTELDENPVEEEKQITCTSADEEDVEKLGEIQQSDETFERETFEIQDVNIECNTSEGLEIISTPNEEHVISATVEELTTPKEEFTTPEEEFTTLKENFKSTAVEDQDSPAVPDESESEMTANSGSTSRQQSAEFKYRWSKIVDTPVKDIGFFPSYAKNDPVLLSWDDSAVAFFSTDIKVGCGDFGGNLKIDGKLYPVETFSVRSYTFEVDLFIKDDVLEDEIDPSASEIQKGVTNDVAGLPLTLKDVSTERISPLTREKDCQIAKEYRSCNEEKDVTTLSKIETSIVSSIRHSPIGDDAEKSFTENDKRNDSQIEKSHSRASSLSGKGDYIVEDIVATSPSRILSQANIRSGNIPDADDSQSLRVSRPPSTGSGSAPRSAQGSVKDMAATSDVTIYGRPQSRTSDRFSPGRPPSRDLSGNEDPRPSASPTHSLSRASPLRTQTPVGSDVMSPVNVAPQRDIESSPLRERIQENGDVGHSGGLMEGRPPSYPGSRHSSQHSSRAQSFTSITSEQELGQYMGNLSRSGSVDKIVSSNIGSHLDNFQPDSGQLKDAERPVSVPSYSTQFQPKTDTRSKTPDNRIRVPTTSDHRILYEQKERTYQDRASAASNHSSRASSRTITPVANEREDLEANITNLRKLLTNRESEVHKLTEQMHDLRDINRSLREDVDHRNKRPASGSRDDEALEMKRLLSEKEIMASEIVTLREEINRLKGGESGRNSVSSGISDYSPNSPIVLQRKITDLEAHIRDLQEVNESATLQLSKAEDKLKYLQEENRSLRSQGSAPADLQADGEQLLRVEMRTLKEDIRNLKGRNFQLTEENMRLSELQRTHDSNNVESANKKLNVSFRSDDGIVRQSGGASRWEREGRLSQGNSGDVRPSSGSQYRQSREHLAPKDLRNPSVLNHHSYDSDNHVKDTSSRLLHQRDFIKPPHIGYSKRKEISSNAKSTESPRSNVLHADRSRPDGEVSEKLQSHRFADSSSYDKKLLDLTRDKSYAEKSTAREYRALKQNNDSNNNAAIRKYAVERVGQDPLSSERSEYRTYSSGAAISSQEIFYNLKQKRANRWVQQDSIADKYANGNRQSNKFMPRNPSYLDASNTEDATDDSDTATDILLAQDGDPKVASSHHRRNSLGSDGSLSSLSDVEDNNDNYYLRRRSNSVDARRGHESTGNRQLSTLHRSGSATRPLTSMDSTRGASGHRSVHPTPLVTQHNKGSVSNSTSLLNSSLTQGMRPFAPRGPSDIRIDDIVKFSRLGGKLSQGVVKYVGHLPGRSDAYLGLELDREEGKHDGTFEDIRYFKCKPSKGVFVAFNKIVMAWAP